MTNLTYAHNSVQRLATTILVFFFLGFSLFFLSITVSQTSPIDFEIYHKAGQSVLNGETPYQFYGKFDLPYQYFPWCIWLLLPLSLLPLKIAWYVFSTINTIILFISIIIVHNKINPDHSTYTSHKILTLFSTYLIMSMLTFQTGQISILISFFCVATIILIKSDMPFQAGLFFPFLILKPHLVILFSFYALRIGGKKYLLSATLTTLTLVILSTLIHPNWFAELISIIVKGQQGRGDNLLWGFSTLAGALELANWRVYNFYIAFPSLCIAIFILNKFKSSSEYLVLILALVLSLFSAPYSFAYDLPLLIPAITLLAGRRYYAELSIFLSAAIPLVFFYQGQSYILIVCIVILFFLCFRSRERVTHAN